MGQTLLAAPMQLPVVATPRVQFLGRDDFDAHEARLCIADGETLANLRRIKRFTPEQHFKTAAQMAELFADVLPSAQANTMEIARRCSLMLVLGKPQLPDFSTPLVEAGAPAGRMPIEACFCKASHEGLEKRLVALFPNPAKREQDRPRCVERLQFELNTLVDMGFPGCFLSVSDFTVRAKENGCAVGPARGCGAGSLVARALPLRDPVAAVRNAAADEVSGHAVAAIAVPCASFSACAVSRRWHACSCRGIRPAMISGGGEWLFRDTPKHGRGGKRANRQVVDAHHVPDAST